MHSARHTAAGRGVHQHTDMCTATNTCCSCEQQAPMLDAKQDAQHGHLLNAAAWGGFCQASPSHDTRGIKYKRGVCGSIDASPTQVSKLAPRSKGGWMPCILGMVDGGVWHQSHTRPPTPNPVIARTPGPPLPTATRRTKALPAVTCPPRHTLKKQSADGWRRQ